MTREEVIALIDERLNELLPLIAEKILLKLPEVVGNLMTNHATFAKANSEFYKAHPEFADHKDVVVSVLERVDGENPLLEYEDKLKKAIPEIRDRINILKRLDMVNAPKKPNRDYSNVDLPQMERVSNNGAL